MFQNLRKWLARESLTETVNKNAIARIEKAHASEPKPDPQDFSWVTHPRFWDWVRVVETCEVTLYIAGAVDAYFKIAPDYTIGFIPRKEYDNGKSIHIKHPVFDVSKNNEFNSKESDYLYNIASKRVADLKLKEIRLKEEKLAQKATDALDYALAQMNRQGEQRK